MFLLLSCSSDELRPRIPDVPVSEQINLQSQLYNRLRQDGGYVYLQAGYKGIILIRQGSSYLAFEQTCPYDPSTSCKVEAHESNLYLIDNCCGSQYNFQGGVMAGPTVYGLKQYNTSLSGSILYVTN
ncbi:hypothetical protein C1N53_16665 [Pontibacter sp. SGAir0037]|nr:hypothetical protein C1N53_16665 [Pontibacter sp. SGAir0037]